MVTGITAKFVLAVLPRVRDVISAEYFELELEPARGDTRISRVSVGSQQGGGEGEGGGGNATGAPPYNHAN